MRTIRGILVRAPLSESSGQPTPMIMSLKKKKFKKARELKGVAFLIK
jgi:hypothetical protein